MILLSYYPAGSQVQLTRVLAQIPEIHQPDDILLFIVEIDNLEVLHDDGTTILSPFSAVQAQTDSVLASASTGV